ncbi:MAG: hypothetical protein V1719_02410 [Patescibacteria group bacterium]
MFTQNQDHFRQIALLLISLTIITMGVVYNQATTPQSQAQFSVTPTQQNQNNITPPQINTDTDTDINIPTNDSLPPEITPPADTNTSIDTNINTDIKTDTNLPEIALEDIWVSLQLLNQLARTSNVFAYSTPEIKLPNINMATQTPTNTLPTINLPSSFGETAITPTVNPPTDNEVIAIIKDWTGYSKWEELKNNFITTKEQYSGTGKCMINIQGLGCLVQW